MKLVYIISFVALAMGFAQQRGEAHLAEKPQSYLYVGADDLEGARPLLVRNDIGGAQVVYSWRSLEPREGDYDFSAIERDLAVTDAAGKKLFIQIQDRFFLPTARNIPDYLLNEVPYGGGLVPQFDNPGENKPIGSGWVAAQWNPAVRFRFQALLKALAERFDGRVFGVNLPETAIDLDQSKGNAGFSCDRYFEAEVENLAAARLAFQRSHVVQYVNFWPCEWDNDHKYMERLFEFAEKNNVGLGGPDVIPDRQAQMKNSYPFFNRYKGRLRFVGMAVQEPTLTYKNPKTLKPFTKSDIEKFAHDYLGADAIFWTTTAPWLRQIKR